MNDSSDQSAELLNVLDEYLALLKEGNAPSPTEYASRFPEFSDELLDCLASLDFIGLAGQPEIDPDSPTDPLDSRRLGDFQILREIGRGGMGVVYEARQISLERRVALKVLPFASLLDPRNLKRFRNESQAAASLYHPHIVPIFQVGFDRGVHFYAMQFIEGQSLDVVIRQLRDRKDNANKLRVDRTYSQSENTAIDSTLDWIHSFAASSKLPRFDEHDVELSGGSSINLQVARTSKPEHAGSKSNSNPDTSATIPPLGAISTGDWLKSTEYFNTVAHLCCQSAEALEHAHRRGVIHRDIKPSNLLLDQQGKLWITDFGLARIEAEGGLTMTGDVMGTLRYMSPEQALARNEDVNHLCDIYALGATLYELVTLQPMFQGNDRQELFKRIAMEVPPRPKQINPKIPVELDTIIVKATENSMHDRYQSAQELADDLRRFIDHRPIRARATGIFERTIKWARRKPAIAGLIAISALTFVGFIVGFIISNMMIRDEQRRTNDALFKVKQEKEKLSQTLQTLQIEQDRTNWALWSSYLEHASAIRKSVEIERKRDAMETLELAMELRSSVELLDKQLAHLRNEVVATLAIPLDLEIEHIEKLEQTPRIVAMDSQLSRIAILKSESRISIRQFEGLDELFELPCKDVSQFLFSPDGNWLSVKSNSSPAQFQVWKLDGKTPAMIFQCQATVLAFGHDSKCIAFSNGNEGIRIVELAKPQDSKTIKNPANVFALKFSFSGDQIAYLDDSGYLCIHSMIPEPSPEEIRIQGFDECNDLIWNEQGSVIAITKQNQVFFVSTDTGEIAETVINSSAVVNDIQFHPNGNWLFSSDLSGVTRIWHIGSGTQLSSCRGKILGFDRVSRKITVQDQFVTSRYNIVESEVCFRGQALENRHRGNDVCVHPELPVVAICGLHGVNFWNVESGCFLGQLPLANTRNVRFHPTEGDLITAGQSGLNRWSFKQYADVIEIGIPLAFDRAIGKMTNILDVAGNGSAIAISFGENTRDSVWVLPWDQSKSFLRIEPERPITSIALSNNGQFALTNSETKDRILIWDLHKGDSPRKIDANDCVIVDLTPDDQFIIAKGPSHTQLISIKDGSVAWELAHDIVSILPNEKFALALDQTGEAQLIDLVTANVIAQFETTPSQSGNWSYSLDRQGARLIGLSPYNGFCYWNLARLRSHLQKYKLDWGEIPRLDPHPNDSSINRIKVKTNTTSIQ